MNTENIKTAFAQHLQSLGFLLDPTARQTIPVQLKALVGEERFRELVNTLQTRDLHEYERMHAGATSLREGALIGSGDADATLEASVSIYAKTLTHLAPGTRVLELGTWTGALASFIAQRHPDCIVVGVDRAGSMIRACREFYRLPNLSFVEWDYRYSKPPSLESADLLLCAMGITNSPDGTYETFDATQIRESPACRSQRTEYANHLKNWRDVAKEGALLYAVLRLPTFGRFLAFHDAAADSDWRVVFDDCACIVMRGGKNVLPLLRFDAVSRAQLEDEQTLLSHCIRVTSAGERYMQVGGAAALALYRQLAEKRVLQIAKIAATPFSMVTEVGVAGAFGYAFSRTSQPNFKLSLFSPSLAGEEAARLSAQAREQSSTNKPIWSGSMKVAPTLRNRQHNES